MPLKLGDLVRVLILQIGLIGPVLQYIMDNAQQCPERSYTNIWWLCIGLAISEIVTALLFIFIYWAIEKDEEHN